MTDELETKVVEAMARARCAAVGVDPDQSNFVVWTHDGEVVWSTAWHAEREAGLKQYRAHLAMQEVLKQEEPLGGPEQGRDGCRDRQGDGGISGLREAG